MERPERILVALGGNALAPPGTAPTLRLQHTAARGAMSELVPFVARGMELVVTQGIAAEPWWGAGYGVEMRSSQGPVAPFCPSITM